MTSWGRFYKTVSAEIYGQNLIWSICNYDLIRLSKYVKSKIIAKILGKIYVQTIFGFGWICVQNLRLKICVKSFRRKYVEFCKIGSWTALSLHSSMMPMLSSQDSSYLLHWTDPAKLVYTCTNKNSAKIVPHCIRQVP
jgi:hypothetical protein